MTGKRFERTDADGNTFMCAEDETVTMSLKAYRKGEKRVKKLRDALKKVLNQPFNGSWDVQAVFVQQVLNELGEK